MMFTSVLYTLQKLRGLALASMVMIAQGTGYSRVPKMAPSRLINVSTTSTTVHVIVQPSSQCSKFRLAPDSTTCSFIYLTLSFGNPPHQPHHC